ncbi:MAG: DNA alkylation repair protein [Actinomycetota bacterium]
MRTADDVIETLRGMASPRDREGMARFGINTERALGISVTTLRGIAKELGSDHTLAAELWESFLPIIERAADDDRNFVRKARL